MLASKKWKKISGVSSAAYHYYRYFNRKGKKIKSIYT